MGTAWFTTVRLLAAQLAELPGYSLRADEEGTEEDVAVLVGAEFWRSEEEERDLIVVAYCGETKDEVTSSGAARQQRGPISSTVRPRDEVGQIAVRIKASSRSTGDAQARIEQILGDLESLLRSNPTLGGTTALNMAMIVEILDPIIDADETTSVQLDATVEYQARI
jgi:hypothetical protein